MSSTPKITFLLDNKWARQDSMWYKIIHDNFDRIYAERFRDDCFLYNFTLEEAYSFEKMKESKLFEELFT